MSPTKRERNGDEDPLRLADGVLVDEAPVLLTYQL